MVRGDMPRWFSSSLFVGIDGLKWYIFSEYIFPTFSELVLGTEIFFQNTVPQQTNECSIRGHRDISLLVTF